MFAHAPCQFSYKIRGKSVDLTMIQPCVWRVHVSDGKQYREYTVRGTHTDALRMAMMDVTDWWVQ